MIGKEMDIDRLLIAVAKRDAQIGLGAIVQVVRLMLHVHRQQQAVDLAVVTGAVAVLMLAEQQAHIALGQLHIERLPDHRQLALAALVLGVEEGASPRLPVRQHREAEGAAAIRGIRAPHPDAVGTGVLEADGRGRHALPPPSRAAEHG